MRKAEERDSIVAKITIQGGAPFAFLKPKKIYRIGENTKGRIVVGQIKGLYPTFLDVSHSEVGNTRVTNTSLNAGCEELVDIGDEKAKSEPVEIGNVLLGGKAIITVERGKLSDLFK